MCWAVPFVCEFRYAGILLQDVSKSICLIFLSVRIIYLIACFQDSSKRQYTAESSSSLKPNNSCTCTHRIWDLVVHVYGYFAASNFWVLWITLLQMVDYLFAWTPLFNYFGCTPVNGIISTENIKCPFDFFPFSVLRQNGLVTFLLLC